MECLPGECVPLRGTEGEVYRLQQLTHQLPAYDHDPEACHKLTEVETRRMAKFVDRRKRRFFGVGAVEVVGDADSNESDSNSDSSSSDSNSKRVR